MKAVKDTLIIEKLEDDEYKTGLISIFDSKYRKCIVKAVGDNMDYLILENDKMVYNRRADAGYHIKEDGKEYLIMRKQDLYGFCNSEDHQKWENEK